MSALSNQNAILDGLKSTVNRIVWDCYDQIKDDSIPLHITVLKIPINIDVKIADLKGLIVSLVGEEIPTGQENVIQKSTVSN